jgi:Protein of unknown function (DUF2510)
MLYQQVRPPFWRRHPVIAGTVLLMTTWWIINGWYEAVAVTAIVAMLIFIARRRRALVIRDAGLRARADYEHRLSLAGDPRGLYGRYPPVAAGWFPDPQNGYQMRYFDGQAWTQHATRR